MVHQRSPDIIGGITTVELLRAGLSNNDGIDAFEMGWVGKEAEVDVATVGVGPIHTRSQMVLKVERVGICKDSMLRLAPWETKTSVHLITIPSHPRNSPNPPPSSYDNPHRSESPGIH